MQTRKGNKDAVNISKINHPDLCGNYTNILVAEVVVRCFVIGPSILKSSGQWWKAVLSFWSVILGGLAVMYGVQFLDSSSHPYAAHSFGLGIVTAIFGFVFACTAIRCRVCGARWVWLAVSTQQVDSWMHWLQGATTCPKCNEPSSNPST